MGHPKCLEVLLRHGANPNGATTLRALTPFHVAAQLNHVDVIHVLAKYGGDLEAKNTEKMTPGYMAAVQNSTEALAALVGYGIDLEAQSKNGETALFGACLLGHTEAAQCLIEAKASLRVAPGIRGAADCEPLYAAAQNGHLGCVLAVLATAPSRPKETKGKGGEISGPRFNIDAHSEVSTP